MMYNKKLCASIKVNGKIMREHDDVIYLPFGSDFSILLKNLNSSKAQVNIKIDGEDVLDGNSLIVDAFTDLELSRWLKGGMKKGPKLKFVEKTEGVREIRDENATDGIVEITYQFEYTLPQVYHFISNNQNNVWCDSSQHLYGSRSLRRGIDFGGNVDGAVGDSGMYCSSVKPTQTVPEQEVYCAASSFNEDGMTVMGEDTKQEFREGYIGILESETHSICFSLKGYVNQEKVKKPITVKTRKECSKCGRFNDWNANFCVLCGNNLKYKK